MVRFVIHKRTLNYSKESILGVFGKYFKSESDAESCARNPQALQIVCTVTGWAMMDRDICGEDADFYNALAKITILSLQRTWICLKVMDDPDLVATKFPMESAIWFFHRK